MSDLYAWVPWFRDLARRIADGGAALALSASPDAFLDQIRKLAMRIRGAAAAAVQFHAA